MRDELSNLEATEPFIDASICLISWANERLPVPDLS